MVGTGKRRGIFNVIVTGHMLSHDGDLVALILRQQQGRRQANDTGTLLILAIPSHDEEVGLRLTQRRRLCWT